MYRYIFLAIFFPFVVNAQLQVDSSYTPEQLVEDVLLGGCVEFSNVQYTGHPNAIGYFNGAASNIGLDAGMIIATGPIDVAIGPNNSGSAGSDNYYPGYAQLTNLAGGGQTFNAAILEFDFVPQADTIQFRYVFGSEEYHEYVCSGFNDVFAFFISGPGYTGEQNIALVPGTTTPVAINTVNNGNPAGSSCTNADSTICPCNSEYFFDNENPAGTTIQYDGFTVVLEVKAAVTPCETYHIKMAIADVGDGIYDSGVFIEANSFSSGNDITIVAQQDAVETCTDGIFVVSRNNADVSEPFTVYFTIDGTAVNGTDYSVIADSIVIPAGQDTVHIVIDPATDALAEGDETVKVTLLNSCYCTPPADSLFISDYTPITLSAKSDTLICEGNAVPLIAETTGGGGQYEITWNNNAGTGDTVMVTPSSTTTYTVTVTDSCGAVAQDSVTVTVDPAFTTTAGADVIICYGDTATLSASGGASFSWSPAAGLSDPNIANPLAFPDETTTYTVTATSSSGCEAVDSLTVTVAPTLLVAPDTATICPGDTLLLTVSGADSYSWVAESDLNDTLSFTNTLQVSPVDTIRYFITGSVGGCSKVDTVVVNVTAPPFIDAGNDTTICPGTGIVLNAEGGENPIWSPAVNLSCTNCKNPLAFPNQTTTYYVTVGDSIGNCTNMDSITIAVPEVIIAVDTPSPVCAGDSVVISASGAESYWWSIPPSRDTFSTDSILIVQPGYSTMYTLNSSVGSCTRTDDIVIYVAPLPRPNLLSHQICEGDTATLDAGGGYDSYFWSTGATDSIINVMDEGNYSVTVDSGGCRGTSNTASVSYSRLNATAGTDTTILLGERAALFATGGTSYMWDPPTWLSCTDCDNPVSTPEEDITYQVVIFDSLTGCSEIRTVSIDVEKPKRFFVPQAFTPNGDNQNDVLYVHATFIDRLYFAVYDQWGERVFETNNIDEGWDGTFKGKPVNSGVFVWHLQIYFEDTFEPEVHYGNVTLIR